MGYVCLQRLKKDKDQHNHDGAEVFSPQHTRTEYEGTFLVYANEVNTDYRTESKHYLDIRVLKKSRPSKSVEFLKRMEGGGLREKAGKTLTQPVRM